MNEEQLLDLTQMRWISPTLWANWQTLNACITEGEQIEAATVLNIINGILSAVIQSTCEVEKLHLEPEDAAGLGRAMDCFSRLYLVYHRQYIREHSDDHPLSSDQLKLQKTAKDADLYGELLSYLKESPQIWRLRQMEAEIQQLKAALDSCQEENKRLIDTNNQSILSQDFEEQIHLAEMEQVRLRDQAAQLQQQLDIQISKLDALTEELNTATAEKESLEQTVQNLHSQLTAQQDAQSADANTKINLEAYIETLKAELESQQANAQIMAQFTSERIAKLESELQAARKELAARPAILSNPELISNSEATPVSELQPNPAPSPSAPDLDSDVFYPNTVTDGVCTLEACGKKKVGMPSAAIRDKIVYLDLTLCDAQEIADHAFVGCANLKRVVLPLSMVIGEESFSDCPNLEEVYLEYTPRIGDRAFCNCVSLKKVYFTSRRTEIGTDAFAGCPEVAFRCRKNSTAAAYAEEHSFDIF